MKINIVDAGLSNANNESYIMKEIRGGLVNELDIGLACVNFDYSQLTWSQMYYMRLGLERGCDISSYNNPYEYDGNQMKAMLDCLEMGGDIDMFTRHHAYTAHDMEEVLFKFKFGGIRNYDEHKIN